MVVKQWGIYNPEGRDGEVAGSFPISFETESFAIIAQYFNPISLYSGALLIRTKSKTGFTGYLWSSSPILVVAIGQ